MNPTFLERVEARLAIRLRSSVNRGPWICETCRAQARTSIRHARAASTIVHRDAPPSTSDRRAVHIKDKSQLQHKPSSQLGDFEERFQWDTVQDHDPPSPSAVPRQKDVYRERVLTIPQMIDPDVWPKVQMEAHAPLKKFLLEQVHPEARWKQEMDASDPYGVLLALRRRDTARMIMGLENAAENAAYIQSIPPTTWTQIIQALNPQNFDFALHRIHRAFNEKQLLHAEFDHRQLASQWSASVMRILQKRRDVPGTPKPDVVEYQLLLTFAAMVGSTRTSRTLWQLMHRDNVRPDRICYNRYMEAIVWDENARLRLKRRATSNFPFKATNIALFQRGRSVEVKELVQEMRRAGIEPDIDTYCLLMMISGRDADLQTVQSLLSNGWHINIAALESGREDVPLPERHPPGSILYPSSRLLVTIAEVYGLANRMPAGFRIIDYIAREYGLKLKSHIWYTLLKWTWLQARVKPRQRSLEEKDPQQLTELTVRTLIDTMSSDPYTIELDLDLHQISFQNWRASPFAFVDNFDPSLAIEIMESVREDYLDLCKADWKEKQILIKQESTPVWKPLGTKSIPPPISDVHQQLRTRKNLHRTTLVKWTQSMLQLPRSKHYGIDRSAGFRTESLTEWRVRGIPRFLALMATFVKNEVNYQTDTGVVNLVFRTDMEAGLAKAETTLGKPERFHTQSIERHIKNRRLWGSRRVARYTFRRGKSEADEGGALWEDAEPVYGEDNEARRHRG